MEDPKVLAAWAGMVVDSTPAFYVEHLKRLRKNGIQPYFVPAHVHQWELIERVIRAGIYMGPLNMALCAYGGGTLGRNPYDLMHFLSRVPQGSVNTFWSSMRGLISYSAMAIVLGQHVRVGNEDNLWGANRQRKTTVEQIEGVVRVCKAFGCKVATAEEARKICKVGLVRQCRRDLAKQRHAPQSDRLQSGLPHLANRWEEKGRGDRRRLT